jgi:hypothetical protein
MQGSGAAPVQEVKYELPLSSGFGRSLHNNRSNLVLEATSLLRCLLFPLRTFLPLLLLVILLLRFLVLFVLRYLMRTRLLSFSPVIFATEDRLEGLDMVQLGFN